MDMMLQAIFLQMHSRRCNVLTLAAAAVVALDGE